MEPAWACHSWLNVFFCEKVIIRLVFLHVQEQVEVAGNKIVTIRLMIEHIPAKHLQQIFWGIRHMRANVVVTYWRWILIGVTFCAFKKLITDFTLQLAGKEMRTDIFVHNNDVDVNDREVITAVYDRHTRNLTGLYLFTSCLLQNHLFVIGNLFSGWTSQDKIKIIVFNYQFCILY